MDNNNEKIFADCIKQAFRYIAIRDHSRYELFIKLARKGYDNEVINSVIDYLESDGSVNEKRYVESFVRSSNRRHPEGKSIMLMRLLSKGADRNTCVSVLDETYTQEYISQMRQNLTEKLRSKGKEEAFIAMQLKKVGL